MFFFSLFFIVESSLEIYLFFIWICYLKKVVWKICFFFFFVFMHVRSMSLIHRYILFFFSIVLFSNKVIDENSLKVKWLMDYGFLYLSSEFYCFLYYRLNVEKEITRGLTIMKYKLKLHGTKQEGSRLILMVDHTVSFCLV